MLIQSIKYIFCLGVIFLQIGCGEISSELQSLANLEHEDLSPESSSLLSGVEQTVPLSYSENFEGTTCEVLNTQNVSVTSSCSCSSGICSVGVTPDESGSASFNYYVTDNTSTVETGTFNLTVKEVVPFKSTWRVGDGSYGDGSNSIKLPLVEGYNYNFSVDWGDGQTGVVTSYNDSDAIHNYGSSGDYTVTITGLVEGWSFPEVDGMDPPGDNEKLLTVIELGTVGWKNLSGAFRGCNNLTAVAGGDTSEVVDMSNMFRDAGNATPITSSWNTSKVKNMSNMFNYASASNPNASNWDTSSVEDMSYMFANSGTAVGLGNFDTSNVKNMEHMFYFASFTPDVSTWDTSKVTNMERMFSYYSGNTPSVRDWDVSSVTNMASMFNQSSTIDPDVALWDTSSVVDISYIFNNATSADPDVTSWNVSKVQNMAGVFKGITTNPNVSSWDTSSVTSMQQMFTQASNATPNTSNWDTSSVTTMNQMFSRTDNANPDTSGWDTSKVTDMSHMFSYTLLAKPNTSGWDTSSVTTMDSMFYKAEVANPDVSTWDTSNVENMYGMFYYAEDANPTIVNWNTSNVTNMRRMFYWTPDATKLNFSNWDFSSVTDIKDFLRYTTISRDKYDNLLVRLDASGVTGLNIHAYNSKYTSAGAGGAARSNLKNNKGWTITDGGGV